MNLVIVILAVLVPECQIFIEPLYNIVKYLNKLRKKINIVGVKYVAFKNAIIKVAFSFFITDCSIIAYTHM